MYHRWTCKKRQLLEPCSFSKRINLQCYFLRHTFEQTVGRKTLYQKFLSDPSPIIGNACQWLTNWLTHCRLVNLIDVTLACEDGNSKLVEVVTVVEVDDEKRVDNSLVQIWKVNFGHKVKFLFGLWGKGFKVCSRFWSWCSGKILKLKFGHYFAADAWLWLWSSFLVEILVWFGQDF